jgi:hypothetical protein
MKFKTVTQYGEMKQITIDTSKKDFDVETSTDDIFKEAIYLNGKDWYELLVLLNDANYGHEISF